MSSRWERMFMALRIMFFGAMFFDEIGMIILEFLFTLIYSMVFGAMIFAAIAMIIFVPLFALLYNMFWPKIRAKLGRKVEAKVIFSQKEGYRNTVIVQFSGLDGQVITRSERTKKDYVVGETVCSRFKDKNNKFWFDAERIGAQEIKIWKWIVLLPLCILEIGSIFCMLRCVSVIVELLTV